METIAPVQSWDISGNLTSPASNGNLRIVAFADRGTNAVLVLDVTTGEKTYVPVPVEDIIEEICFDGLGNVYISVPRQRRVYRLDAQFKINEAIDLSLGPKEGMLWISGVPTGGFVINLVMENRHWLVKYSDDGEEVWRWQSPIHLRTDLGAEVIIPRFAVHQHGCDLFSTAGALRAYRINDEGELVDAQILTEIEGEEIDGKRVGIELPGGVKVNDVASLGNTNQTLILYKNLLLKHEWGQPLRAFVLPERIDRLTCIQNDMIIGLKFVSPHQNRLIFVFDMPDWSQGTVQFS